MKSRRELLLSLGAGLASAPLRALGQEPGRPRRIGALVSMSRAMVEENIGHLDRGLRALGWVDGKNLKVEWRFADGNYERLPSLARELVDLGAEVLICFGGSPAPLAAQKVTTTVPLVFVNVADPVASGLVESLAHPGKNATGIANLSDDTVAKHLEMARSIVPGLDRVALLSNPSNQTLSKTVGILHTAAAATRTKVVVVEVATAKEISDGFSRMAVDRPGALLVTGDAFIFQQRHQIAQQALALRLPSIGVHVLYAEAGGLLSYGTNSAENYHRAASFADRILKGARPGDLPVEQPTRLLLVVNRKTAKAIGVNIPSELLLFADKVIE